MGLGLWRSPHHVERRLSEHRCDGGGLRCGQVLGSSWASDPNSWTVTGPVRAVIWQNGQISALESLLDVSGADWVVQQATAINDAGQIVGIGVKAGRPTAFVMTPLLQ